jgi:cytochrome c553
LIVGPAGMEDRKARVEKNGRDRSRGSRWACISVLVGSACIGTVGMAVPTEESDPATQADAPTISASTIVRRDDPTPAHAGESAAATRADAEKVAITVCGACHGPRGNSTYPKFPRLAAQKASYLAGQLQAFRLKMRGDPDAIAYMWGMASELDDTTIGALAIYYAAQKAERSARSVSSA